MVRTIIVRASLFIAVAVTALLLASSDRVTAHQARAMLHAPGATADR